MHSRLCLVMTSWPFLFSLGLLLLNDMALKAAWPGFITGKLSDFSGIAVVAMLLLSVVRGGAMFVYVAIAVSFLWWKSPASSEFIQFVRLLGHQDFGRTVDYTDLMAIFVLPLCNLVATSPNRYSVSRQWVRRIVIAPIAGTTLLALLGTSFIPTQQEYVLRNTSTVRGMKRDDVVLAIETAAQRHALRCVKCEKPAQSAMFEGKGISMTYEFLADDAVSFKIWAIPNGVFIGAGGYEKADALRNALKEEFSERFRDVEYVESLAPKSR